MSWEPKNESDCFQYVGHRHPDNGPICNFIAPGWGSGSLPCLCYFERVGYRAPKKGEWYLSGAVVEAYRAPNDLRMEFVIVKPICKAVPKTIYVRGDKL